MHLHPLIRIPNTIPVSTLFLGRSFYIKDFQIKFEFRIYSYKLCAPIFWSRCLISVKVISNIVYRINFKRCEGNLRSSDFQKFSIKIKSNTILLSINLMSSILICFVHEDGESFCQIIIFATFDQKLWYFAIPVQRHFTLKSSDFKHFSIIYSRVRNKRSPTIIIFLTFFQGLRPYSGRHSIR